MNKFNILVPPECVVRGSLYESNEPDDLSEDMLEVALPGSLLIQCGWHQNADGNGEYVVDVVRGLSHVVEPLRTHMASEVATYIQAIAVQICRTHRLPPRSAGMQRVELAIV